MKLIPIAGLLATAFARLDDTSISVNSYTCSPDGTIQYSFTTDSDIYLSEYAAGSCIKGDTDFRYATYGNTHVFEIGPGCQNFAEARLWLFFSPTAEFNLITNQFYTDLSCSHNLSSVYTVNYDFTMSADPQNYESGNTPTGFNLIRTDENNLPAVGTDLTTGDCLYFQIETTNDNYDYNVASCFVHNDSNSYTLFDLYDSTYCLEDFVGTELTHTFEEGSHIWRFKFESFKFAANDTTENQTVCCRIHACESENSVNGFCENVEGEQVEECRREVIDEAPVVTPRPTTVPPPTEPPTTPPTEPPTEPPTTPPTEPPTTTPVPTDPPTTLNPPTTRDPNGPTLPPTVPPTTTTETPTTIPTTIPPTTTTTLASWSGGGGFSNTQQKWKPNQIIGKVTGGGVTYKAYNRMASPQEAATFCTNRGGGVATVQTEKDFNHISTVMNMNLPSASFWIGTTRQNGVITWPDGTTFDDPVNYQHAWTDGQPSDNSGEDCVEWVGGDPIGKLNDTECGGAERMVICAFGGGHGPGVPIGMRLGEAMFKGYTNEGNFDEMVTFCAEKGAEVAVAQTQEEFDVCMQIIKKDPNNSSYWIGNRLGDDGVMNWISDGSSWNSNYVPAWVGGGPSGDGECTEINGGDDGGLNDTDCMQVKSFMCKFTDASALGQGQNGGEWEDGPTVNVNYSAYPNKGTRSEAATFCADKGGAMPICNSKQQFDSIFNILSEDPTFSSYWFDAVRDGSAFVWADGVTSTDSFAGAWGRNQPNFDGDCVKWVGGDPQKKLDDTSCDEVNNFFCQFGG